MLRECCDKEPTPTRAILSLVMILNHDLKFDGNRQGLWYRYEDDKIETCPICNELLHGFSVIETSCLHRFHYDCLLHKVTIHKNRFCLDPECKMRIF